MKLTKCCFKSFRQPLETIFLIVLQKYFEHFEQLYVVDRTVLKKLLILELHVCIAQRLAHRWFLRPVGSQASVFVKCFEKYLS